MATKWSKRQISDLITKIAREEGLDLKYVPYLLETVMGESAGGYIDIQSGVKTNGVQEDSWGLWQFNFDPKIRGLGIGLGLTRDEANDPEVATRAAIGHIVDSIEKGSSFDSVMRQNWSVYRKLYKSDPTTRTGSAGLQAEESDNDNILKRAEQLYAPHVREAIRLKQEWEAQEPDPQYDAGGIPTNPAWITWKTEHNKRKMAVSTAEESWKYDPRSFIAESYIKAAIEMGFSDTEARELANMLSGEQIKGSRYAQDRAAEQFNESNEQQYHRDLVLRQEGENKRELDAMDKAKGVYDKVFPFMTSSSEAFLPSSMAKGGSMNQMFDRLGLAYVEPEKLQPNPVDIGAVYRQALGSPLPEIPRPNRIPTMTEQMGPLPPMPEPDRRTVGQKLADFLGAWADDEAERTSPTPTVPSISSDPYVNDPYIRSGDTGFGIGNQVTTTGAPIRSEDTGFGIGTNVTLYPPSGNVENDLYSYIDPFQRERYKRAGSTIAGGVKSGASSLAGFISKGIPVGGFR
mgnify:CR=1 FL=1